MHRRQVLCEYMNTVNDLKNNQKEITLEDMAKSVSLNKNYFIRLFRKETGMTPNVYLTDIRLFHAQIMLVRTQLSISEISLLSGFNTVSYFIKCFKNKYGITPYQYRTEYENEKEM